MAFTVHVKINKRFKLNGSFDDVYRLLADVPESASHFPKVDKLVETAKNTYRWEMEKIGLDRYFIQTVYTAKYRSLKKDGTVVWTPVNDPKNNAEVEGKWTLKKSDGATQCTLSTTADVTVPLPALTKMLLAGLVEREFTELVDEYVANLKAHFES
jgi:carbon monoxide dehydrogenase subunit G